MRWYWPDTVRGYKIPYSYRDPCSVENGNEGEKGLSCYKYCHSSDWKGKLPPLLGSALSLLFVGLDSHIIPNMASTLIVQALIVLVGYLVYHQLLRKPKRNLPPGPKGLPLLGNVLNLPPKDVPDHVHWKSITDKYGPVASVTLLGQPMIFIADRDAAQEILEKKSAVSSGRPIMPFANYCGFTNFTNMYQLEKRFTAQRKAMHKALGTKAVVAQYAEMQEREAGRLLVRTLEESDKIVKHFETVAGAVILKIIYGYTISPRGPDPLVVLIDRMMANFSRACVPFARLVDFIPALKLLPAGFPGTGFKAEAAQYGREIRAVVEEPYRFARRQLVEHNIAESFVARLVREYSNDEGELSEEDAYTIKWSAATMYAGGSDSTVSTLISFILAMTMFPEVQRKAQEEIDRVTGGTRLPVLADREQMPYIEALVTEALRWCTIVPMGVPHALAEDVTYGGYDLPKGAYLLPAAWDFMHDPSVYADPDDFSPERFLAPRNEPDPRWAAFGFGRRICPGRHLADSSLFLNLASLVAVFNIDKAADGKGNVMEPELRFEAGLIAKPKPFPFSITPRSERHVELIRGFEREHPWEESDAAQLGELPLSSH
ncbi:O-methylsterigmatocystin oxidoreductase [Trichoderma ghanense]|uniref:O-methylsterigmatocystin oxidoreductase n=1 Tax=Trichoderma ghanense TaxID=65468 RepID=A0ABY2GNX3_9HYPO